MKKALFWLFAAALAAFLYLAPRMVESSIPTIYYITPSRKTYENVVSCSGTVQAGQVGEVYLGAPAVAAEVLVREGDLVTAGQLIARIDLDRSAAVTASALGLGGYDPDAAAGLQSVDLEGLLSLYGASALLGGSIDLGGLDDILAGLLGGYQAEVVASWLDNLEEEIRAPISGTVTAVGIQAGVPVSAGRSVITIQESGSFKITAAVGEADISKVQVGASVQVRVTGNASRQYGGTVTAISPTARRAFSGTATETVVDVEIELLGGDASLKPGFTARVDILGGNDYELLTVPYEAIRQDENNDEYVYVYEDGKVVKATIITGQELSSEVEVLYGLTTDSVVIYNPGDVVREGSIIHLKGRANVD